MAWKVRVDQEAQAVAYRASGALARRADLRGCLRVARIRRSGRRLAGSRVGLLPRGKLAELVLRDAFTARWAADGPRRRSPLTLFPAEQVGVY